MRDYPQEGGFGYLSYRDGRDPAYDRMVDNGFRDWRLQVDGLVTRPMSLSLSDLGRFRHALRLPCTPATQDGAQ
jgi:DMSO/TMAO reductase YedYZ molybdopterin-dependent catalytic subunit